MTSPTHTTKSYAYCVYKILTKQLSIIKLYPQVQTIKSVLIYQTLNTTNIYKYIHQIILKFKINT